MTDWAVRLEGDGPDLQELSVRLRTPDLAVKQEADGSYYLASTDFTSMPDSGEVLQSAKDRLGVVNGAFKVVVADYQPVEADGLVTKAREDGKSDMYIYISAIVLAGTGRLQVGVVVDGMTEPLGELSDRTGH